MHDTKDKQAVSMTIVDQQADKSHGRRVRVLLGRLFLNASLIVAAVWLITGEPRLEPLTVVLESIGVLLTR